MLTHQKSPSLEQVHEFVIAGHGDLEKAKQMLAEYPELLNAAYPWNENDRETAIQAAAQVGNAPIAEYLLEKGAPLEICTAAMMGRRNDVERLLTEDPNRIHATGAHGISLLTHATLSGNQELVQLLFQRGARTGVAPALHNAVGRGNYDMARWLLENGKPDLGWKNFQGKTALAVATERKNENIVRLLKEHGAII
jgi:ankyrin repeat protein